jgi:lysophospholipase L1-like esterase|tara:strand:- start:44 stop:160 length:117 start_codon:yes stop_codon:yes gene_type:complete
MNKKVKLLVNSSELFVGRHPSALGHKLIAEKLLIYLEK